MHNLGQTRSSYRTSHLLQTPDTFVRAPLPGMKDAVAVVHIAPSAGAGFTQYTAEMEDGGTLGNPFGERFVYVLEGSVEILIGNQQRALEPGGFGHLPEGESHSILSHGRSRVAVIEKKYVSLPGVAPANAFFAKESEIAGQALMGDEALQVYPLIPGKPEYDYAVNVMEYQPGAALSMVEIHVMEHGLLMLEGGGIYRLDDSWYPVKQGDFIWMASYCPQWFGAIGKKPAKYLIYKDWNRHPLSGL
jgi:(S)-ureidoglycine aminohydrolase